MPTNWEYKVIASDEDPQDLVPMFDKAGSEGWELVTVIPVTEYQSIEADEDEDEDEDEEVDETVDTEEEEEMEEADEIVSEAYRYLFKRQAS